MSEVVESAPAPSGPDASLSGYIEARISGQIGVSGNPYTFTQRARPTFEISPADGPLAGRLNAEAVVEAALTEGRDTYAELNDLIQQSELAELLEAANCEYAPEARYDSVSDVLSVERLHVDFNLPSVDLKVGRQAVRWGSGLYFHPTDLYAEVLLTEPWREPKGINAVRADVPIGDHTITGVIAIGDDLSPVFAPSQGTADRVQFSEVPLSSALKATARVGGVDVSAVGQARSSGDWFAGGDVKGTLGVGFWAEGGWRGDEDGGSAEVVVGLDYSVMVLNTLYFAAEYRYDGSGVAPDDYDATARLSGDLPYDCAMLPTSTGTTRATLGRHYLDGAVRLGITQDLSLTAGGLVNLEDGTGAIIPDIAYNASDRVVMHLGAQIPFGADGEFRPSADSLTYTLGTASVDLSGLVSDATVTGWVRYSF